MQQPEIDLGRIAAKLEAEQEFVHKRMSVEVLDGLVKFLGQELNVLMEPGVKFDYVHKTTVKNGRTYNGVFYYDRNKLLTMPPEAAPGLTFHNMGHARYSRTDGKIVREFCEKLARSINRKLGSQNILQSNIPPLIEAAEDERMECRLRRRYRNLGNTYLPRHDRGWRREHFLERFAWLQRVTPKGMVDQQGRSVYWQRAAFATRSIVSGAITKELLPQDMPWDDEIVDKLTAMRTMPTVNEMVRAWQHVLPLMVKKRQEYEEEKKRQEQQQQPQDQQDGDQEDNPFMNDDMEGIASNKKHDDNSRPMENEPEEYPDEQEDEEEEQDQDEDHDNQGNDGDNSDDGSGDGEQTPADNSGDADDEELDGGDSGDAADSESDTEDVGGDSGSDSDPDESGDDNGDGSAAGGSDDAGDQESEPDDTDGGNGGPSGSSDGEGDESGDGADEGGAGNSESEDDGGEADEEEGDDGAEPDGDESDVDDEEEDESEEEEPEDEEEGDDSDEDVNLGDSGDESVDEEIDGEEEEEAEPEAGTQDELEAIKDQVEADQGQAPAPREGTIGEEYTKGSNDKSEVDFITGGDEAGFGGGERLDLDIPPSWGSIRGTVASIIGPIRKRVQNEFKENEIVDKSKGWRSGRFHSKSLIRAFITNSDKIYSRRDSKGQRSYSVYILVDISTSMNAFEPGIPGFPDVFVNFHDSPEEQYKRLIDQAQYYRRNGYYKRAKKYEELAAVERSKGGAPTPIAQKGRPIHVRDEHGRLKMKPGGWEYEMLPPKYEWNGTRYQLATRMTVAIVEALKYFPEIEVGVGAYDSGSYDYDYATGERKFVGGYYPLKEFKERLTATIKDKILRRILRPQGATRILAPLKFIEERFLQTNSENKILIVLTDGEFGDSAAEVQAQIDKMKREGIEMVVLTTGYPADEAAKFVGKTNATEVSDDTIGGEIGKHFRRMVRGAR